jgi:hypothetical protein
MCCDAARQQRAATEREADARRVRTWHVSGERTEHQHGERESDRDARTTPRLFRGRTDRGVGGAESACSHRCGHEHGQQCHRDGEVRDDHQLVPELELHCDCAEDRRREYERRRIPAARSTPPRPPTPAVLRRMSAVISSATIATESVAAM